MTEALTFWAVAVTVAALALPLCFRLFGRFPDAGAGFAFSLGLTLVATIYFLLRVWTDALPAGRDGFIVAVACLGLLMFVLADRDQRFPATLRRALPAAVVALHSALFFGYAFFRAHTPDIAHSEQPMDFLFLNAVLVSPDYPPHDPWFAGENISYYYGGYLQAAALTSVSNVWPATGYNLALAAVFASAGTAAAALCAALARWLFGARAPLGRICRPRGRDPAALRGTAGERLRPRRRPRRRRRGRVHGVRGRGARALRRSGGPILPRPAPRPDVQVVSRRPLGLVAHVLDVELGAQRGDG